MRYVLVCENTFDGMMTAVYDGWVLMNRGHEIHVNPGEIYDYELMTEYVQVETDSTKAIKVSESIKRKISMTSYTRVYRACMHYDRNRVDAVIDYLKIGYKKGSSIDRDLGLPEVMRVVELARKAGNEAHNYKGFVRFSELEGGILVSRIAPKCDVLLLIKYHFEERFPLENWVIYDETRQKALFHRKGAEAILVQDDNMRRTMEGMNICDDYEQLWNIFFNAIGIEERENKRCQDNHIPLWYRKNMPEFNQFN